MRRALSLNWLGFNAAPLATAHDFYVYALSVILIVAAYARLLVIQAAGLWAVPSYRYFPLLLAASLALIVYRASERRSEPSSWSQPLVFLSLAFLASGIALDAAWFASASAFIFLAACILRVGGWLLLKRVVIPWLLLALLVRLPFGADVSLVQRLTVWIFATSAEVLDGLGVLYVATPTRIMLPNAQFDTNDFSLIFLFVAIATAGLYCSWQQRGWIQSSVVMAWTAVLATAAEIARLVILVTLTSHDVIAGNSFVVNAGLSIALAVVVLWLAWNLDELIAFRLGTMRRRKRKTIVDATPPVAGAPRPQVGFVLAMDGEITRHESAASARISTGAWTMLAIGAAFAILLIAQTVLVFAPELRESLGSQRDVVVAVVNQERSS
jgi:hypothetical protein